MQGVLVGVIQSHDGEMLMDDTSADRQTRADEYEPEPLCFWCNEPIPDTTHEPYCSTFCAVCAERDSNEDYLDWSQEP